MTKERLSVLMCGALLFAIPSTVFAAPRASDISVRTIYFADGTSQSTATLQGPVGQQGPIGLEGPAGHQGITGANGYNSLLLITDEIAGSNCANGGTKVQVGLDLNRSGALDFGEVVQTKYMCNGTTPVPPTSAPITVTASPSTQTVNSFTSITATLKNADGTPAISGSVSFMTSGSCVLYDNSNNPFSNGFGYAPVMGGTASIALTNNSSSGGPCIVYADYWNPSTQVEVSGSALATFVPDSGTQPVPQTSAPITVTASPSTQTVNSFTNITATLKNADGTPAISGSVSFMTSGSCVLYDNSNNPFSNGFGYAPVMGGTASIALTNNSSSGGPCIVYADYWNPSTQVEVSGSALATFVPQVP